MAEHTRPDPKNALTWPEHSPAVAMDVALGSYRTPQNFDMPAYNRMLDQERIGKERSDLLIEFKHRKKMGNRRGSYYDEPAETKKIFRQRNTPDAKNVYKTPSKYIEVAIEDLPYQDPQRNSFETNRTLLHETKHFLQDVRGEGPSTKEKDRRRRIISVAIATGSIALGAVGFILTGPAAVEAAALIGFTSPLHAVPAHFIGKRIAYRTDPSEKDAHHFANNPPTEESKKIYSTEDL